MNNYNKFINIYIVMFYEGFLYYYICVIILNKKYVGCVKIFMDRYFDRDVFFIFFR